MGRLLVWLLMGLAAWWLLRPRKRVTPPGAAPRADARAGGAEPMVSCARCGLHLPDSEAVRDGARLPYCCAAHRDAGPRDGR